jgi:hypothetical protein
LDLELASAARYQRRPHQNEAIEAVFTGFETYYRGRLWGQPFDVVAHNDGRVSRSSISLEAIGAAVRHSY